jgi:hypothetical protein
MPNPGMRAPSLSWINWTANLPGPMHTLVSGPGKIRSIANCSYLHDWGKKSSTPAGFLARGEPGKSTPAARQIFRAPRPRTFRCWDNRNTPGLELCSPFVSEPGKKFPQAEKCTPSASNRVDQKSLADMCVQHRPAVPPVCFHCYRLKGTESVPERTVLL